MTAIASHITAFLRHRLPVQRAASPHTCDSYAIAFRLLFEYAATRLALAPSDLALEQLDAELVLDFLDHLELERCNGPATRNARLAAIKSFFRFVEHREPALLDQCRRILAIPSKKTDTRLVSHLTMVEMRAVLDAPDVSTRAGLRDRAMLHLCFAAGLRVSELVSVLRTEVQLHPDRTIRVMGKGRKERCLPLWKQTAEDIRAWSAVRGEIPGVEELFVNARDRPMGRSGFAHMLDTHGNLLHNERSIAAAFEQSENSDVVGCIRARGSRRRPRHPGSAGSTRPPDAGCRRGPRRPPRT